MINLSKEQKAVGETPTSDTNIIPMPQTEIKQKYVYDKQCKAFFLTFNNPDEYGYSQERIIDIMHTKFKNVLYWCMCDEQGSTYHRHLYILLSHKKRWSAVQRAFQKAHIESEVKGTPQECRAYIRKEGAKYANKAETNVPETFYEEGSIPDFFITADKTEMLQQIEDMLDSGLRPNQIMEKSIVFRQYESIIRKQFFAKRFAETPPLREVKVTWHLGASGTGKSYTYVKLCEEHGADEVFYASDYANGCASLMEGYESERIIFLDEVKPDSFKYGYLLQLLQGYRTPVHARYTNIFSLWNEVHVSSIYEPRSLWESMVDFNNRSRDSEQQLLRRITNYVYHWKTEDGEYHTFELPAKEYISFETLKRRAEGTDGFEPVNDSEMPFDD
jgi:hypothetical protein